MTKKRQRAGIWLATLSAVVGVATGMFTLRDQVFESESGSAGAVSGPVYRHQVGRVCDRVNDDDRYRAQQDVKVRRRLERATTTTGQRNALLDGVRRTSARSEQTLATFNGFATPKALAGVRRGTEAAWNRNLARVRGYAQRLDGVTSRAQLLAAVKYLSHLRSPLAKDGVALRSGLERLGGAQCDLQTSRVTPTFPLPALPHGTGGGASVAPPPPAGGGGASLNAPAPGGKKPSPGAETPGASANTPGPNAAAPSPDASTPSDGTTTDPGDGTTTTPGDGTTSTPGDGTTGDGTTGDGG